METINFFTEIKPVSTIFHVLSAVVGMGAALMGDFLFNFYSKDKILNQTEIQTLNVLSKIVWYGLLLLLISGLMLFFSNPDRYLSSDKFLAKMTILVVLVLNGFFLSKEIWPRLTKKGFLTDRKERKTRKIAFACGTISVISWISVLAFGVLNSVNFSYVGILAIYALILVFGIIVSQYIEKKKLD
ncbi:hypothetical protein A2733_00510 [Candidatus Nomurabacteria bacterium RIFCSPHIGHO2_01_FULL_40_20]|uniref:DUF2269 domain-containing protein n=1 Tax=Candidatus Nomurabacteria bacterium RIFCSPHIGHO2_01_FULL_40_20 TaxID=1801738 RepID=A0A1F6V1S3_9BACT|nr:MAG: hypothetical protein A2733_00510 [Candidatus Nomurabacteria bacterium RIFCSPHIGHO2_01_FULL_40_20]